MPARTDSPRTPRPDLFGGEFDRGRSYRTLRPEGTSDWLLIYTAAGSGCISHASDTFSAALGDVILYAPGDFHDYKTDPQVGRWHLLWVHFVPKAHWRPWLNWPTEQSGVRKLHLEKGKGRQGFVGAMHRMLRSSRSHVPNSADFSSNALEELLLWAHVVASRGSWTRLDPRVRNAMDYLTDNLRRPFHFSPLAQHCGLSISRLAHLFKAETGMSPQQFSEQQRLARAGDLLRQTALTISEVAEEIGYEDPFYFSNRFRKQTGKSPSEFRKQQRKA